MADKKPSFKADLHRVGNALGDKVVRNGDIALPPPGSEPQSAAPFVGPQQTYNDWFQTQESPLQLPGAGGQGNTYSAIPEWFKSLFTANNRGFGINPAALGIGPGTAPSQPAVPPRQQAVQNALSDKPKGKNIELPSSGQPLEDKGFMQELDPFMMSGSYPSLSEGQQAEIANGGFRPNIPTAGAISPDSVGGQHVSSYDVAPHAPVQTGFLDSLKGGLGKLDAQDWTGIAGLGLGATGMFMNAATQKDQFNKQFGENQRQFDSQLGQRQAEQGLQATQLNPYQQQNDLYSMAVKGAIGEFGPAQAQLGTTTPLDPARPHIANAANQFLNDNALANAAGDFELARLHADPNATPRNLASSGLGAAGAEQDSRIASQQQALKAALQPQQQQQHHDGFWKKFGKIASIAAPIAAAPFTGGASLALIGAGAGAANGLLNGGGVKGALMGGALGAIPMPGLKSGFVGPVQNTLTAGLKQAAKNVAKPNTALAIANALR